jgi:NAD-dependent dihydropyrimidine dehydrogenase PreA subunit
MDIVNEIAPREDCKHAAGQFAPVIDRNRCEGKGPCVDVCRYRVLTMGLLSRSDRLKLTWKGRIKASAHGNRQAFVVHPEACAACGDCVQVCPEHAIQLRRVDRPCVPSPTTSKENA